jgi:predicted transcriptional regulator
VAHEADYYTAHEAARELGLSPARVRQMLRAGELQGERGPERMEGVLGPWRIPASVVSAYRDSSEGRQAVDAAETIALPREEITPGPLRDDSGVPAEEPADEAPSETSERLSEGVGALRDKIEEILKELDRLENRLEAAEVEHIALRAAASREKERADRLEAERAGGQGQRPGP